MDSTDHPIVDYLKNMWLWTNKVGFIYSACKIGAMSILSFMAG